MIIFIHYKQFCRVQQRLKLIHQTELVKKNLKTCYDVLTCKSKLRTNVDEMQTRVDLQDQSDRPLTLTDSPAFASASSEPYVVISTESQPNRQLD